MRRLLIIFFLTVSSAITFAQRIEKVAPRFSGNKEADLMIQYICDNLQIVVPAGKDLNSINAQMRCKVTVDFEGKVTDITITKHTVVWLELSIVDGLRQIPPSENWTAEVSQELQKELVFSFGNWRKKQNEYGFDTEKIANNVQNRIDVDRDKEATENAKQEKAWSKAVDDDLKIEMPLSPEYGKNPNPEMKTQGITTPDQNKSAKIQISIE